MNALKVVVCLKQVPDPEGPTTAYDVDVSAKKMKITGIPPVINPYDENALEAALKLKDEHGASVTLLTVGEKLSKPVLTKGLGAGADSLVLVEDTGFNDLDSTSIAYVLHRAIETLGGCDLVLAGRQAGDWDAGQTGACLSQMLNFPLIHLAVQVSAEEGLIRVKKLKRDGYEIVRTALPAVVTVDSQIGNLRYPSLKAMMSAKKIKPVVFRAADLQLDSVRLIKRKLHQLNPPPSRLRQCVYIEGDTLRSKGENLALKLRSEAVV